MTQTTYELAGNDKMHTSQRARNTIDRYKNWSMHLKNWFFAIGSILFASAIGLVVAMTTTDVFDNNAKPIFTNYLRFDNSTGKHVPSCKVVAEDFRDVVLLWVAQFATGIVFIIAGVRWNYYEHRIAIGKYYARYGYMWTSMGLIFWYSAFAFGAHNIWEGLFVFLLGLIIPFVSWSADWCMSRAIRISDLDDGDPSRPTEEGDRFKFRLAQCWHDYFLETVLYLIITAILLTAAGHVIAEGADLVFEWIWALFAFEVAWIIVVIIIHAIQLYHPPMTENPFKSEVAFSILFGTLTLVVPWIAFAGLFTQGDLIAPL